MAVVKGATNRNIPCEGVYLGVEAVAGNQGYCLHLGWPRAGKRATWQGSRRGGILFHLSGCVNGATLGLPLPATHRHRGQPTLHGSEVT